VQRKVNLIFSGSSTKFPIFIGVLKAIEELNVEVHDAVGNSGGSLTLGLWRYGYSAKHLESLLSSLDLSKFFNINIFCYIQVLLKGYLNSGSRFRSYLKKLTNNVSISSIKDPLKILTTDFISDQPILLTNHSSISLADAIYASCCIPIMFKGLKHRKCLLYDGGLKDHFPIIYAETKIPSLGVIIKSRGSISSFKVNLVSVFMESIYNLSIENTRKAILSFPGELKIITIEYNIPMWDFTLDHETKREMIQLGYEKCKHALMDKLNSFEYI